MLNTILKILGIIILSLIILILVLMIIFIFWKPYGIDVLKLPSAIWGDTTEKQSTYDHPALTTEQEVFLETIGVDVSEIPTSITADQAECLQTELGDTRAQQLINGAEPTMTDYLKAKNCF